MKKPLSIMWFRRDLRLNDNHALLKALLSKVPVLPIFIFDTDILDTLPKDDHRISYIHKALSNMDAELKKNYNSSLAIFHGKPIDIFAEITKKYDIQDVYINHDYEPYAKKRDVEIERYLETQGVNFQTYKDQVIFEKSEVVKDDQSVYVVYTPYMKRWKANFNPKVNLVEYDCDLQNYTKHDERFLSLTDIGFVDSTIPMPEVNIDQDLLDQYGARRDFPAQLGTSHVGTSLRFGTTSTRRLMNQAITSIDSTFMNELIWREFFMQILWHFPHTANQAFREKYDLIPWRDAPDDLQKWKDGQTGYPIVDAGMRELNTTGYMHNRVRMVVASFLCKHLLIDWREGERYFAEKLFDYELSSNVGNWQWVAGSGVDAAPYFRVFNPETQMKKFDPDGKYVRKWVPEYFGLGYVSEMIEHKAARERALETYKAALNNFEQ
ncbi:MAG: deoxyribodipyrimidine photo-lyase [Flavobacteriaceae bacterium]|jgi:deoxyribodipyrimidine photo-lyase